MSLVDATSLTTSDMADEPSEKSGRTTEDHSQRIENLTGKDDNKQPYNADTAQMTSDIDPAEGGKESPKHGLEGQPDSQDITGLSKRITRAIDSLNQQVTATLAEHKVDFPPILNLQIENLHKLGKDLETEAK